MEGSLLQRLAGLAFVVALVSPLVASRPVAGAVDLASWCDRGQLPLATPVGIGSCPGVRPGGFLRTPIGGCTYNFLFQGSDGNRYIGTAGHCFVEDRQEKRWTKGGPVVTTDGAEIGRGAYAINSGDRDFALIRVNKGVKSSAQMCHFGGPLSVDIERLTRSVMLEHYGNGIGISEVVPARTSAAMNTSDPNIVVANGAAIFGDSGSGVTRDGKAIGVLVAAGVGFTNGAAGYIFITRLGPQVKLAEIALKTKLTLQKAPRL